MKTFWLCLIFILGALFASAADQKEKIGRNRLARKEAMAAFRAGDAPQAVSLLKGRVHPIEPTGSRDLAVAEELIAVAYYFYNRGEMEFAMNAASEAVAAGAVPALKQVERRRLAMFYNNLGRMCDVVLLDRAASRSFYQKALGLNPALPGAQHRLKQAEESLRQEPKTGS